MTDYEKRRLENLNEWFFIFTRCQYSQDVILKQPSYNPPESDNSVIYEGNLSDLTYIDILNLMDAPPDLIQSWGDKLVITTDE